MQPTFMDLSAINPEELIFSDSVYNAIATNLFNPVEKTKPAKNGHNDRASA